MAEQEGRLFQFTTKRLFLLSGVVACSVAWFLAFSRNPLLTTSLRMDSLAIALDNYQAEHGTLPADLDVLELRAEQKSDGAGRPFSYHQPPLASADVSEYPIVLQMNAGLRPRGFYAQLAGDRIQHGLVQGPAKLRHISWRDGTPRIANPRVAVFVDWGIKSLLFILVGWLWKRS